VGIEVITGDPVNRIVQLSKITDGGTVTFNIPTSTPVKAAIVSLDRLTKFTDDVSLVHTDSGADWSVSKLAVVIPKTETEKITEYGKGYIEIQVADTYELTWAVPVTLTKGNID